METISSGGALTSWAGGGWSGSAQGWGPVGQWHVDEDLVLASHDLMGVDGLHVAEPPGLTFGRWLGKRGSHEAFLPTQCPGHPAAPARGTALWAHTLCLHLPSFSLSLPFLFAPFVCECVCVLCVSMCVRV